MIANIWNGSLDKRNICTMLQRGRRREGGKKKQWREMEKRKKKKSPKGCGCSTRIIKPLNRSDGAELVFVLVRHKHNTRTCMHVCCI